MRYRSGLSQLLPDQLLGQSALVSAATQQAGEHEANNGGAADGNGFAAIRNKKFSRLIIVPVNLASSAAGRVHHDRHSLAPRQRLPAGGLGVAGRIPGRVEQRMWLQALRRADSQIVDQRVFSALVGRRRATAGAGA